MNTQTRTVAIPEGFKPGRDNILSIRDFPEGITGEIGEILPLLRLDGTVALSQYGTELYKVMIGINFYWADGGFRGAYRLNGISPGDLVFVAHEGEGTFQRMDEKTGRLVESKIQKYIIAKAVKTSHGV